MIDDESLEDYIAFQCYKKLKKSRSAGEIQDKLTSNVTMQNLSVDAIDFLSAWQLKEGGNKYEEDMVMKDLLTKNPLSKSVQ